MPGTVSDRRQVQRLGWIESSGLKKDPVSVCILLSYCVAIQECKSGSCDCICILVSKSSNKHYLIGTKNSPKRLDVIPSLNKERLGDTQSLIQGHKILEQLDEDWPPVQMSNPGVLLVHRAGLTKEKFRCKMADTAHTTADNDEVTAQTYKIRSRER